MALPPGMAEWFSRTFKSSGLPAYQMSGPGLQAARAKQTPSYYGPAYASAEALGIKPGGLRNYGAGYKEKELAAGAAAERFRPGAGFPGQQGMFSSPASVAPGATPPLDPYAAQNRAYQQERARVEAMVKSNPDMQKQEIADARAKVRDQGMAIWQQKYGATPMGQPGGAVGSFNPLMDSTFGYQSGSAPGQQMGVPTLGPSPLVPQVDQSLNPASPNFIGGEGAPLMNFADPRFENMSTEEFQKLLNQVNKK